MDRCTDNTEFSRIIDDVTDDQAEILRALADAEAIVIEVDDIEQLRLPMAV